MFGLFLLALVFGWNSFVWTPAFSSDTPPVRALLFRTLHGVWTGILIVFLAALLLGVIGVFSLGALALLTLAISIPRAVWRGQRLLRDPVARLAFLLPTLTLGLARLAPDPGHWIAGGWDPGIYMNQGMALARTGSFVQEDDWFQQHVPEAVRHLFLRRISNRVERFPGLLSRNERIEFEFFRFYPAAVGVLDAGGGVELASRLNLWLALLALLSAAAWGARFSVWSALAFPLVIALQPVFLYHTHVPVTEMLEVGLLLWVGAMLFAPGLTSSDLARTGLAFFCAALNRFTILPLAALLILLCALGMVLDRLPPQQRLQRLAPFLLLGIAAFAVNMLIAPVSFIGWSIGYILIAVFAFLTLATLLLATVTFPDFLINRLRLLTCKILPVAVPIFVLIGLTLAWLRPHLEPIVSNSHNLHQLVPFMGAGWIALGALGSFLAFRMRPLPARAVAFAGFLLLISALLLYQKNITDWYPWALRRYLPFTVPLLALAAVLLAEHLRNARLPPLLKPLALLLLFGIGILPSGNTPLEAARLREYRGLAPHIAAAADAVPDHAVLIADDARWGTPMMLLHDKRVLHGVKLWRDQSGTSLDAALAALHPSHELLFFTSTPEGMHLFPDSDAVFETIWEGAPFETTTIIHSSSADHFALRHLPQQFQLHRLLSAPPEPRAP